MIKLSDEQTELFKQVQNIFQDKAIYAVGGCVRDILLGIEPKDYDFCIGLDVESIETMIKASGRRAFCIGKRFGTIACKVEVQGKQHMIEVTQFRSEEYEPGSRKPKIEFVGDISSDLSRRDFTINSMALRLDNFKLIDPYNGQSDLTNKVLKCVGNPKTRFHEDPLRILRAIRFASRFALNIEEKTLTKLTHCVPNILEVSKERWMLELDAMLLGKPDSIVPALNLLWSTKVWNWIIPELSLQYQYNQNNPNHSFTLDVHTIFVVSQVPEDINLRWAALLHDIAKPFVRTEKTDSAGNSLRSNYISHELLGAEIVKRIGTHLKWSSERIESVSYLVLHHMEDTSPLCTADNNSK